MLFQEASVERLIGRLATYDTARMFPTHFYIEGILAESVRLFEGCSEGHARRVVLYILA